MVADASLLTLLLQRVFCTGTLITFFPVDSLHQSRHADKRSRSKSPSTDGKKERQHRRRLFESFGVIPSLQVRSAREVGAEEALDDEMEEDSDEVLNIPSLLMTRRVGSFRFSTRQSA